MNARHSIPTTLLLVSLLSACSGRGEPPSAAAPHAASAAPLDQANICEVKNYGPARACQPGQKVVFLPPSFGNEQLPILFVAMNCDLRYSVALTHGGVACIYTPMALPVAPDASAAPNSAPASAPGQ